MPLPKLTERAFLDRSPSRGFALGAATRRCGGTPAAIDPTGRRRNLHVEDTNQVEAESLRERDRMTRFPERAPKCLRWPG
jgi:hypothetical protein